MAPVNSKRRRSDPPHLGDGAEPWPDHVVISDLPAPLPITARELDVLGAFFALLGDAAADVRLDQAQSGAKLALSGAPTRSSSK